MIELFIIFIYLLVLGVRFIIWINIMEFKIIVFILKHTFRFIKRLLRRLGNWSIRHYEYKTDNLYYIRKEWEAEQNNKEGIEILATPTPSYY